MASPHVTPLVLPSVNDALLCVDRARAASQEAEFAHNRARGNFVDAMIVARVCGAGVGEIAARAQLSRNRVRHHLGGAEPYSG